MESKKTSKQDDKSTDPGKISREQDEITDYAQHTINEMLRWYGLHDQGSPSPTTNMSPANTSTNPTASPVVSQTHDFKQDENGAEGKSTCEGSGCGDGAGQPHHSGVGGTQRAHLTEGSPSEGMFYMDDKPRPGARKLIGMRYLFPPLSENMSLLDRAKIWVARHDHKYYVGWTEEQLQTVEPILRPIGLITAELYKLHMNRSEYCRNVKLKYCLEADTPWAQEFRHKLSKPCTEGGFTGLCQAKIAAAELWRRYSENYKSHQARYPNPKSKVKPRKHGTGTHRHTFAEGRHGKKLRLEFPLEMESNQDGQMCSNKDDIQGVDSQDSMDSSSGSVAVELNNNQPNSSHAKLIAPLSENDNRATNDVDRFFKKKNARFNISENYSAKHSRHSDSHNADSVNAHVCSFQTNNEYSGTSKEHAGSISADTSTPAATAVANSMQSKQDVSCSRSATPNVQLSGSEKLFRSSPPKMSLDDSSIHTDDTPQTDSGDTVSHNEDITCCMPSQVSIYIPRTAAQDSARQQEYRKSERGLSYLFPSLSDQHLTLVDKVNIIITRHKNNYFLGWPEKQLSRLDPLVRPKMVVTKELYKEYCHRNAMKYDSNLQFAMESQEPWAQEFRERLKKPGGFHSLCEVKQEAGRLWREYSGKYRMHNIVKTQMVRNDTTQRETSGPPVPRSQPSPSSLSKDRQDSVIMKTSAPNYDSSLCSDCPCREQCIALRAENFHDENDEEESLVDSNVVTGPHPSPNTSWKPDFTTKESNNECNSCHLVVSTSEGSESFERPRFRSSDRCEDRNSHDEVTNSQTQKDFREQPILNVKASGNNVDKVSVPSPSSNQSVGLPVDVSTVKHSVRVTGETNQGLDFSAKKLGSPSESDAERSRSYARNRFENKSITGRLDRESHVREIINSEPNYALQSKPNNDSLQYIHMHAETNQLVHDIRPHALQTASHTSEDVLVDKLGGMQSGLKDTEGHFVIHLSEANTSSMHSSGASSALRNFNLDVLFSPLPKCLPMWQQVHIWLERYRHSYFLGYTHEQLEQVDPILRPMRPVSPLTYLQFKSGCNQAFGKLQDVMLSSEPWARSFKNQVRQSQDADGFPDFDTALCTAIELWDKHKKPEVDNCNCQPPFLCNPCTVDGSKDKGGEHGIILDSVVNAASAVHFPRVSRAGLSIPALEKPRSNYVRSMSGSEVRTHHMQAKSSSNGLGRRREHEQEWTSDSTEFFIRKLWQSRDLLQSLCQDNTNRSWSVRLEPYLPVLRERLGDNYRLPSTSSNCIVDLALAVLDAQLVDLPP